MATVSQRRKRTQPVVPRRPSWTGGTFISISIGPTTCLGIAPFGGPMCSDQHRWIDLRSTTSPCSSLQEAIASFLRMVEQGSPIGKTIGVGERQRRLRRPCRLLRPVQQ
jgi:hypothetical protein